jgi:hypothetical protein
MNLQRQLEKLVDFSYLQPHRRGAADVAQPTRVKSYSKGEDALITTCSALLIRPPTTATDRK